MSTAPAIPWCRWRGFRCSLLALFVFACAFVVEEAVGAVQESTPGLDLHWTDDSGAVDHHIARLPGLWVEAGRAPSPFLSAEASSSTATFEGWLSVRFLDDYEFRAFGCGELELSVDGQAVLAGRLSDEPLVSESVELDRGRRKVRLVLQGDAAAAAVLRLEWASFDFDFRPIPPKAWSRDSVVEAASSQRRARESFVRHRCAHCHAGSQPLDDPHAMPELAAKAPQLDRLGERLRPEWVARWLEDPRALRPHGVMPRPVLATDDGARRTAIADLVAFLCGATQGSSTASQDAPTGDATRGEQSFEQLGCFTCHELDAAPATDALGVRVSLHDVGAKYTPTGLIAFLRAPAEHAPGIGMPDFDLDQGEAEDLAAFLLRRAAEAAQPDVQWPEGDARRGDLQLVEAGCLGCHDGPGDDVEGRPPLRAVAEAGARGCLSTQPSDDVPRFDWDAGEREALLAFLPRAADVVWADDPADYAQRMMASLRCLTCHDRDGVPSLWSQLRPEPEIEPWDEPEDEEISQKRPALTHVGEGLRPEWMQKLFAGEVEPLRPWLDARMPRFDVDAKRLAHGLAAQHGLPPTSVLPGPVVAERSTVGEALLKAEGGLGCVQCHDRGLARAAGVFDAQGPDFARVPGRLRRAYFDRLLTEPRSVLGSTKMPSFVEDGRTAIDDVDGGDAALQFEALWQHMVDLQRRTAQGDER